MRERGILGTTLPDIWYTTERVLISCQGLAGLEGQVALGMRMEICRSLYGFEISLKTPNTFFDLPWMCNNVQNLGVVWV